MHRSQFLILPPLLLLTHCASLNHCGSETRSSRTSHGDLAGADSKLQGNWYRVSPALHLYGVSTLFLPTLLPGFLAALAASLPGG